MKDYFADGILKQLTRIADALEKPTTAVIGDAHLEDRKNFPNETYAEYIDRISRRHLRH